MRKRFLSLISIFCVAAAILSSAFSAYAFDDLDGRVTKEEFYECLYDAEISDLREAILRGLITSEELTNYYLDRIEKYNETWNCFITLTPELAIEQAKARDEELKNGNAEGKLFGIPVVVKDNIDVEGIITTNGYKKTSSVAYTAKDNANIVQNLINEGAVIIGKTNMSTGANEARVTISKAVGETLNAYNIKNASGGSSGGTAVSVSLNFAATGLGTDTNSSLRLPAVLNGCVSLRASRGIMDSDGIVILSSVRDTPGTITRTVKDQAIMLDVITGGEYSFENNLDANVLDGMRIGILKELSYATTLKAGRKSSNLDKEVQDAFANAVSELESLGAEVVTVSLSNLFTLRENVNNGKTNSATKYKEAFEGLLESENISAVIFPTYLSTPMVTGKNEEGNLLIYDQTYINNCSYLSPPTGCPEMSLVIGFHSNGSGIGMEICSSRGNDSLLLNIAYSYTEKYDKRVYPTNNGEPQSKVSLADFLEKYETIKNTPITETEEETTVIPETTGKETETEKENGMPSAVFTVFLVLIGVFALLIFIVVFLLCRAAIIRKRRRKRRAQRRRYNPYN